MRLSSGSTRVGNLIVPLSIAALVLTAARVSHADQFILFDATFTYTWQNATTSSPSLSHYYVNEGNWLNKARPVNWMAPVNYRDGTVHVRVEVLEKPPGTQMAGWALCYVANVGSYGCPYTPYYMGTGVYESNVGMTTFFNNATIQWASGIKQVDLVYTVNPSGSGHITNFPELQTLVTPTRVRITMIQVSQGATYDPSILPAAGGGDGGVAPDSAAPRGDTRAASDSAPVDSARGGTGGSDPTGGAGGGSGGAGGGASGTGPGGSAGAGGSAPPSGGAAGMTPDRANGAVSGGCTCSIESRGGTPSATGYALLVGLALFWASRRKRSRRPI
jgi:uncharacterized membrane protein YgcG